MDIEAGTNCNYDVLKIIDGTNEFKYCGTMDNVPDDRKYIESTGNHRNPCFYLLTLIQTNLIIFG